MRSTTIPRATLAFGAALALGVGLAACSPDDAQDPEETGDPSPSESMDHEDMTDDAGALEPSGTGDPFADARTAAAHMPETAATLADGFVAALDIPGDATSPAADLRAGMTHLLQEHVYLAGIGVATAYVAGPDSPQFEAASAAIDTNSVDLADAVTELAGAEAGETFLMSWRAHIGDFVDYAVAVQAGDQAAADEAVANLTAYTETAGAFFEEVSGGELPAADVTAALQHHVMTLAAAVDALAAGSPDAFDLLREAATHMPADAAVLATGLATAVGLEGDPNDEASSLRSDLTAMLGEHVYAAGVAVFAAYTNEGGTESEPFTAAAATLDANSVALSEAIGSLAGEENGTAFLELWREHIGFFVDYANALATGDEAAATDALAALDGYRGGAGAFFSEISGGELPADAIADGLAMHVETLAGTIDSLAAQLVTE
ncbi:hypothetical protein Bcav_3431 [Beutenbergia cavernae DSM 12333]|uniref:Copper amine oxidase n=1 Tax=Beutenbergia cavernae (strain ATCC BAA-8 / DSM 12333 / CCUG 43141 / JCM 11478 / NBRC 16432 / NCIMB 13614 / HKI 0122) TaxID=471853 RepID=C5C248_BEUC1|nr:hypothetical protein [Beutenbergia cavernae]ACQ81673.1 hypothetical protein Bcav_3431 [Beutenbergia cavernae DSM 12333]